MKRRSFLISACVIALVAVLAGCSDTVVIPEFPTGGFITANGDLLEGQKLDSNKFTVVATYTNGQKTITGASIVSDGTDPTTAHNGDKIYAYVGNDINANPVYAEGQVTAYLIESIDVEVADTVYAIGSPIPASDLVVTANYRKGNDILSTLLVADEYSVGNVTPVAGSDADAEEVPATVEIKNLIGGIAKPVTVEVTGSRTIAPAKEVAKITAIGFNGVVAGFNYDELPVLSADDAVFSVEYTDGTTDVNVSVADAELTFINQTTKEPLNKAFGEYDFKTFKNVGVAATFNDETVTTDAAITIYSPTIKVEYFGDKFVQGEALPAIDTADYRVTLTVGGELTVLKDLTASDFVYRSAGKDYTEATIPASLGVMVRYMGVESNVLDLAPGTAPVIPVTLQSVAATLEDFDAPAKQFYNALPKSDSIDKDAIKVVATYSNGSTEDVPSANFTATYYYDMETPLADIEKINENEYDLASVDHIYILVAYGATEEGVAFVEVPLAEPVATGAYLVPEYKAILGTAIDWSVVLTNDEGRIGSVTSGYKVWSGTASAELPKTVTADQQGPYFATYNGLKTDNVTVNAGISYVIPGENGFVISLKNPLYYGDAIPTDADSYVIDENSWDPMGEGAEPKITKVETEISGQTAEEANTVKVTVSYVDVNGETQTPTYDVDIESIGWIQPGADGIKIIVDGKSYKTNDTIPEKYDYQFADFTIDPASYEVKGEAAAPVIKSMATADGSYQVVPGTEFSLLNGGNLAINIEYAQKSADVAKATITLNGGTV